ncbi:MAG: winged helix DNA-binding domain-containing protein [Lachnospiraceae bacterium]|nr:winged helix DNA-binding domain-containing protein [Lachnospiraceae bacterium]
MSTISRQEARQFILSKQGLIGQHRFIGKDGAYAYVCQAGCIQFDPVDVCGKNAELTLQSRVKNFKKTMLYELLYKDRKLVDYADKELSIWPSEDWPYFSSYRERSKKLGRTFKGLQKLEKQVMEYIEANGPVSSDSLPIEGEIFWHSSMHWSGNWQKKSRAARSVLEQLYTDGELVIHHKKGSRKYYDIAVRHLPKEILEAENPCKKDEEFLCWRVLRRIGAVGLLWDKNSTAFLGLGINAARRKKALETLTEEGKIIPVMVEGIKQPFYYRAEDSGLMRAVLDGTADLKPRMSFIAPLDPLMWDKSLISALWDFQYSWEIYTPAAKRRYAYYTLPILFGESFAGRIEAVPDRKTGVLAVRNVWWEDGIRQTKKLYSALERTVKNFAKFNDCKEIEYHNKGGEKNDQDLRNAHLSLL